VSWSGDGGSGAWERGGGQAATAPDRSCPFPLILQSGIHVHIPHAGSELMAKPPHVVAEGRKPDYSTKLVWSAAGWRMQEGARNSLQAGEAHLRRLAVWPSGPCADRWLGPGRLRDGHRGSTGAVPAQHPQGLGPLRRYLARLAWCRSAKSAGTRQDGT